MKRRLRILISALSLLPSLAVVALWVRGYSYSDLVAWEPRRDVYTLFAERGEVCFRQVRDTFGTLDPWRHEAVPLGPGWRQYVPPYSDEHRAGGFWWETGLAPGRGQRYVALVVPCWSLAAASLAPVAWAVRVHLRRRRRARSGQCRACGYNLTGNVSGVCPECGQVT